MSYLVRTIIEQSPRGGRAFGIYSRPLKDLRGHVKAILAAPTGQPVERVAKDVDRDYILGAGRWPVPEVDQRVAGRPAPTGRLLVDLPPVRTAEQATEPSGERRTFCACQIDLFHRRTTRYG